MEKAMAPHSSTLAWRVPWTEEPGGLQSMGSLRIGHDWATSRSLFTFTHWRRKWQPTPVLLPGKCHGWRSLVQATVHGIAKRLSDFTFTFIRCSPVYSRSSDSVYFISIFIFQGNYILALSIRHTAQFCGITRLIILSMI